MNTTLQDQVRGLSKKLQMLAMDTGYIDTKATTGVRTFYEHWQTINTACIAAGFEDGGGDLSFVSDQLQLLLENFPADKTTIGILEVFPFCFESSLIFGTYIAKLDSIAQAVPS